MINDFNEIKNEKDRELYVQCRQLLDQFFLDTIEHHELSDHKYHECFNDQLKKQRGEFLDLLKEEKFDLVWIQHNIDKMMDHMRALMILSEYISENDIEKIH